MNLCQYNLDKEQLESATNATTITTKYLVSVFSDLVGDTLFPY